MIVKKLISAASAAKFLFAVEKFDVVKDVNAAKNLIAAKKSVVIVMHAWPLRTVWKICNELLNLT